MKAFLPLKIGFGSRNVFRFGLAWFLFGYIRPIHERVDCGFGDNTIYVFGEKGYRLLFQIHDPRVREYGAYCLCGRVWIWSYLYSKFV